VILLDYALFVVDLGRCLPVSCVDGLSVTAVSTVIIWCVLNVISEKDNLILHRFQWIRLHPGGRFDFSEGKTLYFFLNEGFFIKKKRVGVITAPSHIEGGERLVDTDLRDAVETR
jgi:hypothetical protein